MNLLQLLLPEKNITKKKEKKKELSKDSNMNRLIDAVNDPKNNTAIYAMHHIVKPQTDF